VTQPHRSDPLPQSEGEALFLAESMSAAMRTLGRDFVNFTLNFVFYAVCLSVGSMAARLEDLLGTNTFERFLRFAEYVDERRNR
jgi:hypothetical protein